MFNFFKAGIEFNNLAKSINGMNIIIQDLIPQIEKSCDKSEFTEEVLVLAYIAKKGVFDRLEKYNWDMDAKIIIPTIAKGYITLSYSLMQTIGKIAMIASELNISGLVEDIMDGGSAFFDLERTLPNHIKNNI